MDNIAICTAGIGAEPWGVLAVDAMPDLGLLGGGTQVFPRWVYRRQSQPSLWGAAPESGYVREDNISVAQVSTFRRAVGDDAITADTLFAYVYGVLHAPDYVADYQHSLFRELPRVPIERDFWRWYRYGAALLRLHLLWETDCDPWPLAVIAEGGARLDDEDFLVTTRAMRMEGHDVLRLNRRVRLFGFPALAADYTVCGRSPLEWQIRYLRVTTDPESRITNDPNSIFRNPREIVSYMGRLATMAAVTAHIIAAMPPLSPVKSSI